jgi:hypothetical protein
MKTALAGLLKRMDITEVFKTKGDLRRWSAKRTIGGMIAITACEQIVIHGITWEAVALAGIGIIPLTASMFENESRSNS